MKDNFDREDVADELIAENVYVNYIEDLVDSLNDKHSGPDSDWFFRAVEDDYRLSAGWADLI